MDTELVVAFRGHRRTAVEDSTPFQNYQNNLLFME